jgi:HSP20 family protein
MTNEIEKTVHTLVPAVDIVETKNSYIVKLDIPGAVKEKVKAQIEENTLTVTAEVAEYFESDGETELMKEYRREFSLANDVDLNTVDAQCELGVLTVTLNKKPQFLPKEITIN